ncbi:hypothetical protein [Muricoccus radiodurans]|uniref:hypothetical protein n=1 Tax=Muricoccus radiodurans TaxID=2231721 RepID=UPI003CF2C7C7
MADKKNSDAQTGAGNGKSSGGGGGKGASGGAEVDIVGNAKLRGEDPSPDNRGRGETASSDANNARTGRR